MDVLITDMYHQMRGPHQLDQMIGMGMNLGPKAYCTIGIMWTTPRMDWWRWTPKGTKGYILLKWVAVTYHNNRNVIFIVGIPSEHWSMPGTATQAPISPWWWHAKANTSCSCLSWRQRLRYTITTKKAESICQKSISACSTPQQWMWQLQGTRYCIQKECWP